MTIVATRNLGIEQLQLHLHRSLFVDHLTFTLEERVLKSVRHERCHI